MLPLRSFLIAMTFVVIAAGNAAAQNTISPEELELRKNWSLFTEYQKNGDEKTAIPYAWKVYAINPTRFKTLYERLADAFYALYEKGIPEERKLYADSIVYAYDLGIKHVPEKSQFYYLRKGYALELYFENRTGDAIAAYETALGLGFKDVDFSYIDRLGLLYVKEADKDPELRVKALELYRKALEREPANEFALDRVRKLSSDPQELIDVFTKKLESNPNDIETLWSLAQVFSQSGRYEEAEKPLKQLIKLSPNATYWNQLAIAQLRGGKFRDAIKSNEEVLKLNPSAKENMVNIAQANRELKNFALAKQWAQRAIQADKNWGRPHIEIGEIFKAAVEDCVRRTKNGDWSKLDINDRLVYKLANDSYLRAKSVDPSFANEADLRIRDLSTLVPQREDYFFYRSRIQNNRMALEGECYAWIGEAVPVPAL